MAIWKVTAKRDIGNVIKKGTSINVVTIGTAKPQWHQVKKELNLNTSISPSMTDAIWIIEKIG
jgi:deoxyxylulose-5-phosphate synthase